MKYRPEVDGLRAIAVLSVLFYHARVKILEHDLFTGGFLGVDIFFVISGYLITSILLKEMNSDNFSFLRFYERRVRRILPALYTMMLVTFPAAYALMLPKPFREYAGSFISTVFFGSNIFFWRQDSYTAELSTFRPLLHTWSLSLEEQYYLLFPLMLLFCIKFGKKYLTSVLVISCIFSLQLAQWASLNFPGADFYLLPTRMWELLAGSLLAQVETQYTRYRYPILNKVLPTLGLALILYPTFSFTDHIPHPSYLTAIPVAGATMLIWFSGGNDFVSRVLKSRIFVAIGLVSYSLYLWHQPVFVFHRLQTSSTDSFLIKLLLFAITGGLSYLAWRFVEKPFRNKSIVSRSVLWTTASVTSCALLFIGFLVFQTQGFPDRFHPMIVAVTGIEDPTEILKDYKGKCLDRLNKSFCVLGDVKSPLTMVMLGDSHLQAISSVLWSEISQRKGGLIDLNYSACFYAPTLEARANDKVTACTPEVNAFRRAKLLNMPPAIILVGGRLPLYVSGDYFDNGEGGVEYTGRFYLQSPGGDATESQRQEVIAKVVRNEIQELLDHGHKVVLLYPLPEVGWNVPHHLSRILLKNVPSQYVPIDAISTSYHIYLQRTAKAREIYNSIPDSENLIRIYPDRIFCNTYAKDRCVTHDAKEIFYFDDDHLSTFGAKYVVDQILSAINENWGI